MLYSLLKIIARLALPIFCRKIIINKPEYLKIRGPVLLACNHPNSFLDSIILDTLFQQPIWSLARGDAFKNKSISRLLRSLKIMPVYRTSEGVENLSENYKTFDACIAIFKQKGIVTIFSEGKCINEWHLRPLKKGTARLAIKAWEEGIPLVVLPVGINYSSFTRFGKNVWLNFGEPIKKEDIPLNSSDGLIHQVFNNSLQNELKALVFEISKADIESQKEILEIKTTPVKKILLGIPALLGWLIHVPISWPVKIWIKKKTLANDHYDSVITGLFVLFYSLFVTGITVLVFLISNNWWSFLLLLLLPFAAWSYVQVKAQTGNR
ncbi:MAG: 1-acyl-sn-glycerol-3-phosphate acyltransferase [Chitinophagaceae bacterium]|nr:1-acyl-sn-glycerol-3-phosphate acyltransferase [Chitinophagaceae bacterium]